MKTVQQFKTHLSSYPCFKWAALHYQSIKYRNETVGCVARSLFYSAKWLLPSYALKQILIDLFFLQNFKNKISNSAFDHMLLHVVWKFSKKVILIFLELF